MKSLLKYLTSIAGAILFWAPGLLLAQHRVCDTFNISPRITSTDDALSWINGIRFISENDVFFPVKNGDKNYTGQFRLDIFTKGILDKGWGIPFPRNFGAPAKTVQSFFLNGQGYTPARKYFQFTEPVQEDRPFASFICIGYQRTAVWDSIKLMDRLVGDLVLSTEATAGMIGSKTASKVQNFLHEYIVTSSKPVLGWPNQIGSPGRFTWYFRLNANYYFPAKSKSVRYGIAYEVMDGSFMRYHKFGISLTDSKFGILARTTGADIPSILNIYKSNAIASPLNCLTSANFKTILQGILPDQFEFLPSVKYVQWNTMLSGHPIEDKSIYTISSNRVKKFVPEASLRLMWHFLNQKDNRLFSLFYAMNWRGKEFNGGDASHFYGSIGIRTMKIRVERYNSL